MTLGLGGSGVVVEVRAGVSRALFLVRERCDSMTSKLPDKLVEQLFAYPEHAAEILREVLEPLFFERMDWTTFSLWPGHFLDKALSESRKDLLFSARVGGQPELVYLLFERLRADQPPVSYLQLNYELKIWRSWIAKNASADELPGILLVVFRATESGWEGPIQSEEVGAANLFGVLKGVVWEDELRWAHRRTVLRLIDRRFGPPHADVCAFIQGADVPTLIACLERLATASSVEEVLGWTPPPAAA
ncbi:MAG: Rpn family recombination-promoting nuclease/putative transposase [Polyangiaceae bacterium]